MHFAAVSNFPLEIFIKAIPNLPETKHRQWYFQFPEFWSIPYKQKLNLQVTKLDKRYTNNFTITSCQQILTSLLFLWLMANLEQSRSWTVIRTFSLTAVVYLRTTENRVKTSVTELFYYCLEWKYYKKTLSTATYVLRTKFQVSCRMLTSLRQWGESNNFIPYPSKINPLKVHLDWV